MAINQATIDIAKRRGNHSLCVKGNDLIALINENETLKNAAENWEVCQEMFATDPRMETLVLVDKKLRAGWRPDQTSEEGDNK